MGFVSPGDCLSGATFPIPEFFAMRKSKFASDAIDEAIAPLFPRDSDDAIRELVEKSVARVVGKTQPTWASTSTISPMRW